VQGDAARDKGEFQMDDEKLIGMPVALVGAELRHAELVAVPKDVLSTLENVLKASRTLLDGYFKARGDVGFASSKMPKIQTEFEKALAAASAIKL
jgi:hypothetical protein